MLNIKNKITYNKPYIVILPDERKEFLEGFDYSFGNVYLLSKDDNDFDKLIKFIERNNFSKIIFVDYVANFEKLIYKFKNTHDISFVCTMTLGTLSNIDNYYGFRNIIKYISLYNECKLAVLDKSLYKILKNKYDNVCHILLDIRINNSSFSFKKQYIGLLNENFVDTHSYYNELSAFGLLEGKVAKISKVNNNVSKFNTNFNINFIECSEDDIFKNNLCNLYINFSSNNTLKILKSFDYNVPCIVGNTSIFDDYKTLKNFVVMKSDDDVNEIKNRVLLVEKNRTAILKEYEIFRNNYHKESKTLIEKFLGIKVEKNIDNNYEKLLSVIVPVYNVYDYLDKALKSIIDARIDDMEIIIINDGSTDKSEDIILKYVSNYPNLITYIKQKNHGLGNVRNVGLKHARGKYIASIDSDDSINKRFFKRALPYLKNNIDMVIYDWNTVTDKITYRTAAIDEHYSFKNRYKGLLYTSIMPSTCNKIIKKELFTDLDIKYIEDKYEDLSTNPFIFLKAKTIKYINRPYYNYYIRNNSIMRTNPGFSMINVIKEMEDRLLKYKDLINVDLIEFKFYTYSWRIEEFIFNPMYELNDKDLNNYIEKTYEIKEVINSVLNSSYYEDMLNKLDINIKNYILERNKYFFENKLNKFVKDMQKKDSVIKLTAPLILFGKN